MTPVRVVHAASIVGIVGGACSLILAAAAASWSTFTRALGVLLLAIAVHAITHSGATHDARAARTGGR